MLSIFSRTCWPALYVVFENMLRSSAHFLLRLFAQLFSVVVGKGWELLWSCVYSDWLL